MPKEKKVRINYTARDFDKIKKELVNHAQRYYPDNYRDFSTPSFGSMVLDMVSYVGDVMSYYLDYNVNESFLDTSIEFDNIRRHARSFGYNFNGTPTSFGVITLYVIVPSNADGTAPDPNYIPIVRKGTNFTSNNGGNFMLTEDVDFSSSNADTVAARFDATTGQTTFFAIRTYGQVESGIVQIAKADLRNSSYKKFRKVRIGPSTITDVISVTDSDGNIYYKVDNLSQEVVFIETTNKDAATDGVRSILKPFSAPRRFTVERDDLGTYLQFGFGSDQEDQTGIVEPAKIALKMHGKNYIADKSFDPSKLLETNKLGISPSNTMLRIVYKINNQNINNTSAKSITTVNNKVIDFGNPLNLVRSKTQAVIDSLEVINEEPIYSVNNDISTEELKQRVKSHYSSQNRAVTKQDYESLAYNMPGKFGSIRRVNVVNPSSSTNRAIKMYVIGEDSNGKLAKVNSKIKNNLKTWLTNYKSISDNIEIQDAKILNFGVEFHVNGDKRYTSTATYNACIEALNKLYSETFYVGEPIYISRIYETLNKLDSVLDVKKVRIFPQRNGLYSGTSVDFKELLSKDGTYYKAPKNCIFELKYPKNDIKGSVV